MVSFEKSKNMIANLLTFSRIIYSFLMLMFPTFSSGFYICYLLAGFTDMIDGTIARRLGTSSEFGARLDTVADFIFATIALYRILPEVKLSIAIYIWIGIITVIKLINVISGFVVQKQFITIHSVANKITGLVLFMLPLTLPLIELKYTIVVVCMIASFAAIQEGHIIRSKCPNDDRVQR